MVRLLHELILEQAHRRPDATAVVYRQTGLDYATLASEVQAAASGLRALGLRRGERVAVYLPKRRETVIALFGAALADGVFVPVNPLLKPEQVAYILRDCNVRVVVTASDRAEALQAHFCQCPDLRALVLVDAAASESFTALQTLSWPDLLASAAGAVATQAIDIDMAAILYTSGSTGKPKGVVLSHRNMLSLIHI